MTSFKNPQKLNPAKLVEYHSHNDDFFFFFVLSSNDYACLMRLVNPEGILSGYLLFDYKMDNGTFIDKSTYSDAYEKIIKLAQKNGLKNTPKVADAEELNFKSKKQGVFTQLIAYLEKNKIYAEIEVVNPNNRREQLEYDGFIDNVSKDEFVMKAIDDLSMKHTEKVKLKFQNLYSIGLGNWQQIFINDLLAPKTSPSKK